MPPFSLVILYVDSPDRSADFYRMLLGRDPIEQSPTFAMFSLSSAVRLGLWSRHGVEPAAVATGGGAEVAFIAEDVDRTFSGWTARGVTMLQPPCDMDFGRSFVAADPDGHRLRVYAPA